MQKITRREFITLGAKAAAGAVILSACGIPEKELIIQSPAELPEDLVRGEDAWYATAWPDAPGGDGLIARVVRGRVKKLAGNPDHPVNMGKQNPSYDPAIQILYHPDRITAPLIRRSKGADHGEVSWDIAMREVRNATQNGAVVITNPLRGYAPTIADRFVSQFGGRRVIFHPLEQGVLHRSVGRVFNADTLPDIDIANARTVLSFGADWLSGWVSPTRYAAQYGKFRSGDSRGSLVHVEARFSLTAANADLWLPAKPGTEGDIALAMARVIIDEGLASDGEINQFQGGLPPGILFGYAPRDVASRSGVSEDTIIKAARRFASDRPSVAFGGGSAAAHTNGSVAIDAIYSLNHLVSSTNAPGGVILNPSSPIEDVSGSAYGNSMALLEEEIAQWRAGFVDTVIIRGADIVFGIPEFARVRSALENVRTVIAFTHVMNDTADIADIVLPETTFLEEWGLDLPEPGPGYRTVTFQQPVAGIPSDQSDPTPRSFGDVMLDLLGGLDGARTMRELVSSASDTLFNIGTGSIRASNRDLFFRGVLQRGGWWDINSTESGSARPINPFEGSRGSLKSEAEYSPTNPVDSGDDFHLLPFETGYLANGRLSPAPWALQCADPISTIAWTTWAEISKYDAERMDIREGDILLLRSESGEMEVVAYPHPAAPPGVISVPIGFGHQTGGRYAAGLGDNVLKILSSQKDEETGALAWAATRVKAIRSGRRIKMPKFEGTVEAFQREPGVPVLIVAPGETAEQAEEGNHALYQEQFLGERGNSADAEETKESHE